MRRLGAKYSQARYANFGPVIESITISGFRGVTKLRLELDSPVTAISGLNGTGKSTIAQLLACAYRAPESGSPYRSYIVNWFPVSVIDPKPFEDDARVLYEYADKNGSTQKLTVSRVVDKWSGYKRQPQRATFYAGITHFVPKIEKRDFSVYGGARLTMGDSNPLSEKTRHWLNFILAKNYQDANITQISLSGRRGSVAMVTQHSSRYSENHMGFGEGRIFYIVNLLETAPERSLIILEEPETALHGDAQKRLAQYLIDASMRRGHQIILTTHSSAIMGQFARESVILLRRDAHGSLSATPRLSTYQIESHLSQTTGASICVEDKFAEVMVTEMLRANDPDLLSGVGFLRAGDVDSIAPAVQVLRDANRRAVGISDTEQKHDGADDVYAMPGDDRPEVLVFNHPDVQSAIAERYNVNVPNLIAGVSNHHDYPRLVSNAAHVAEEVILTDACRAWVAAQPTGHFDEVMHFIRTELADRR